ncbi:L,D-transpeptidase family protein [Undibacterium cyanobacteriorum]|uniref:L,D-transpeptidase family protein n=1 Tax=Undibacterium cyanobacteriorum TaxID=3073561 RepID=A0ABY9RM66_9BURK|nr:L,D-transpeptidase family protein [Undibacterium sp. 20NA77.5]WMW82307.1 L,D-transpeptidase family protein [Undibacterium sp. 20NA77.5]
MVSIFRCSTAAPLSAAVSFAAFTVTCGLWLGIADLASAKNNPPKNSASKEDFATVQTGPNPDYLLIDVYKNLANNQYTKAQTQIDALLAAYPNFQLGHLIRGDLIAMRTKPETQLGASNVTNDKLRDLRAEAQARVRAITERPAADLVPLNLLNLASDQRWALVMDAQRARIFLYENVNGIPTLRSDYYVSQGKFGVDKSKEGDQRTPLGVYFITNRVPGAKLPDFYGPGALPLNYPNEWDKLRGRGGSGIWLHGVPATNYSRAPLASDGCVVLANPDFLKLAATVDIAKTPVIIADRLNFVNRHVWLNEKQNAQKMLDLWRQDFASANPVFLAKHYSRNFKNLNGDNAATWIQKQLSAHAGLSDAGVKIKEQSQFKYPGREDVIVSFFTQEIATAKGISSYKRRQYWQKDGNAWSIVFEDSSFLSGTRAEPEIARTEKTIASTSRTETNKSSVTNPSGTIGKNEVATSEAGTKQRSTLKSGDDKKNTAQAEVIKTVDRWMNAWAAKNTKAYLSFYGKDFQTPNGESRKSWMEERKSRIEGKGKIVVRYESPSVAIEGNTATVKFRQHYQSGALVASSRKTLVMTKQDGKWLIKQEKTGS